MPNDGTRMPVFAFERDEPIARRDVENPLLFAVGPVREAAARKLARRRRAARAFALAVHPQLLRPSPGRARRPRGGCPPVRIQHAVGHHRRRLEHEFRPRPEMVGLEPPCDGQRAEVRRVDLIERRISRVPGVAAVRAPFAVERARLAAKRDAGARACENGGGEGEPRECDRNMRCAP